MVRMVGLTMSAVARFTLTGSLHRPRRSLPVRPPARSRCSSSSAAEERSLHRLPSLQGRAGGRKARVEMGMPRCRRRAFLTESASQSGRSMARRSKQTPKRHPSNLLQILLIYVDSQPNETPQRNPLCPLRLPHRSAPLKPSPILRTPRPPSLASCSHLPSCLCPRRAERP